MGDISFARGDLYVFPFAVFIDDEQYTGTLDSIYFTVKKHYFDENPVFQKKLSDGSIIQNNDGTYTIRIEPEDTENLAFGTYDCDIQVEKSDDGVVQIKRTFFGKLKLFPEVTHAENESEA